MLHLVFGIIGLASLIEGIYRPIRGLLLMAKAANEHVYLKVVQSDGYSFDDYLDFALIACGICLLVGSLVFWLKAKNFI
jgi:hypothetical protein